MVRNGWGGFVKKCADLMAPFFVFFWQREREREERVGGGGGAGGTCGALGRRTGHKKGKGKAERGKQRAQVEVSHAEREDSAVLRHGPNHVEL